MKNKIKNLLLDYRKGELTFDEATETLLLLYSSSLQLPSKDAEFIYDLLPMCCKKAPKGLDATMYLTLTQEGDQNIVNEVERILK